MNCGFTTTNEAILAVLQTHGRTPEQDRDNLLTEMQVLLSFLQTEKESGLRSAELGAMGGLQHCLRRLYAHAGSDKTLSQMAERYAEAEIESYPEATPATIDEARAWGRDNGVVMRLIQIPCPDGLTRTMLVSHLNQTTIDGHVYVEGEFVHNPRRKMGPFSVLLDYLRKAVGK